MKRKFEKRLLGFLIAFTMLFSSFSTVLATEFPALNRKIPSVAGETQMDAIIDSSEITLEKVDLSQFSVDNSDSLLLEKGISAGSNLTTLSQAKAMANSEELNYVYNVANELTRQAGIIGLDKISSDETVEVFVWLQQLPDALDRLYSEQNMGLRAYDSAKENAIEARAYINAMANMRSSSIKIDYEYFEVFSGFAIKAAMPQIEEIAAIPGVYMITEVGYSQMDYTADPNYETPGNAAAREIMEIADLHAAGIDGTGVKVGVIDSGIDANHPDLMAVYKGGYNFADKTSDMTLQDGNHGTHVAGTIASQGIKSLGAAPGVDLYMAQVFTATNPNSANNADTTAAIEAFTKGDPSKGIPKVDIINMSMGNNVNTAYLADRYARNNSVIAGVTLVCSAGNNAYPKDNATDRNNYTLGSGGVSLPISVAASQYGGGPSYTYKSDVSTKDGSMAMQIAAENGDCLLSGLFSNGSFGNKLNTVDGKGYELYLCMNSVPKAGEQATTIAMLQEIPDNSLTGKILVVGRGIDFYAYKEHAIRADAGGLIIVNRDNSYIGNMNIGNETNASDLVIFSAKAESAKPLLDLAAAGDTLYLNPGSRINEPLVKEPAPFSSIGPVNETAEIKPDIIAPGYGILSTSLNGEYVSMGGTSMSSPWVAGIAALIKQKYPEATPAEIKARMMNTSDPDIIKPLSERLSTDGSYYFDKNGTEISVFEQGAGFINPKRAIYDDVYITVTNEVPTGDPNEATMISEMSSFSFGNTEQNSTTEKLTAKVHGLDNYSISVVYNHDTRYSNKNLNNDVAVKYTIDGDTFDVWLEISANANDDAKNGGNLYEGYIIVTGGGKDYVLPWATRVGTAAPAESDDWLIFPDRPVQAAWDHEGQDWSTYSARNMIFMKFGGKKIMDTVQLRTVDNGNSYNYYLDVLLLNPLTFDDILFGNPITPAYRYAIGLGTGDTSNLQLSDFLQAGSLYYLNNGGYGLQSRAYACNNGNWDTVQSDILPGNYQVGLEFKDKGYDFYFELGVTITDERPTLTVENTSLNPNITEFDELEDVTLTSDADTYGIYELGADEYTVKGKIFSPAIDKASKANDSLTLLGISPGFSWGGYYLINYDELIPLDQSLNVLEEALYGTAFEFDETPWICDGDGNFSLTFPVPANKDKEYLFNYNINFLTGEITWAPDGAYHSARAADAFDISRLSTSQLALYGALNTYNWTPYVKSELEIFAESIKIDNPALSIMRRNETLQLSVIFTPTNVSCKDIVYTSSNENIAVVDENGLVTAVGTGSAIITAKSETSNKSAVITVRVSP